MKKILQLAGIFACSVWLAVSCDTEPELPDTPGGLKVETCTATTAGLSWTAVDGAEKYNVSIDGMDAVAVASASYEATGLTPETDYTWKVQAVKGDARSDWANGPAFTTLKDDGVPAPTGLAVTDVTVDTATLSWQHPGADSHEVVINNGEAVSVVGLSYGLTGLAPETEYVWKIRSCKNGLWSVWVEGDKFTTKAIPGITPDPTDLDVTDITHDTATLSWEHPGADFHEVVIGNAAPVTVNGLTYMATGLTPESSYPWKVRSCKYDVWSEWVDGYAFSTGKWRQYSDVRFHSMLLNGSMNLWENYGPGTSHFMLSTVSFDPEGSDLNGWWFVLDIIAPPVDESMGRQCNTVAPNNVLITDPMGNSFTVLWPVDDGNVVEADKLITGGTMTIAGDHTDYDMTFDIALDNGAYSTFTGSYDGPLYVPNLNYLCPVEEVEFKEAMYVSLGTDDFRIYYLALTDTNAVGNEHILFMLMYAPGTAETIPDGTYTVGSAGAWKIDTGSSSIRSFVKEEVIKDDQIVSGTATTTKTGADTYTIVMDLVTKEGKKIRKTYSGFMTFGGSDAPANPKEYQPFFKPAFPVKARASKQFPNKELYI